MKKKNGKKAKKKNGKKKNGKLMGDLASNVFIFVFSKHLIFFFACFAGPYL